MAPSDAAAGTAVYVTGYPEGGQLSVIPGLITDYISGAPYGIPGQVIEMTNAIEPGSSGSPVLDTSGNVVGVAFATSKLDGASLAIPVSALKSYLDNPGSDTLGNCAE
jgi:S1-C subfamily serine protease